MRIVIAGGHGQIARRLGRHLTSQGEDVAGLIRNVDHAVDLRADGVHPVRCDLEHAAAVDVAEALEGADAVVFAAGAGPGSGAGRKASMDRDGAIRLLRACETAGVDRYVMVSAMGAAAPPPGDEVFAVYLRAKHDADEALMASGLRWTIVRPGALTDDPGTGLVQVGEGLERGEVPREDVAGVLAACLQHDLAVGRAFDLVSGDVPVQEALQAL